MILFASSGDVPSAGSIATAHLLYFITTTPFQPSAFTMKSAPFTLGLVAAAQAASLPENFQRTRNVASEVLTGCRSDLHGRFEISVAPNDNSRVCNSLVVPLT